VSWASPQFVPLASTFADAALDRFGRIDTLINNAGVFVPKPFTDYTAADYALVAGVNLAGFFWLTQRVIADMARRYGGHVVDAILFLESSPYITGEILHVDGGQTAGH
jgi:NAD(P)-dependent dehydrogenase (short-subunit alcohol dehydrogenase family)